MNNENLPAMQEAQPFARMMAASGGVNAGSVAIEQERAVAEAQGKLIIARRFPRSMVEARQEFMEACADPEFAATAFYAVKNRGNGPSIRFAEEIARCYGHMDYGHRELSRSEGKSEVEVYAWDMQRNNFSRRQITVEHVLDTQDGPRKLRNQGDIDNRIANIASKQVRSRILALMPKALVAAGIARCKLTIAGGGEKPLSERIAAMVAAFSKYGVTTAHLAAYLEHSVDHTTLDELADLMGIYNALKDGAKPSEYFPLNDTPANNEANANAAAAIAKQAQSAPPAAPAPARPSRSKPAQNDSSAAKDPAPESSQTAKTEPPAEAQPPAEAPAPAAQEPVQQQAAPQGSAEEDVF